MRKNWIFEKIEFGFDSSIEEHVKEPETPTNNRSAKIYRRQLKKMSYIVFQNLTHFGSFWCKIIENQWFPAAVNNLGRGRERRASQAGGTPQIDSELLFTIYEIVSEGFENVSVGSITISAREGSWQMWYPLLWSWFFIGFHWFWRHFWPGNQWYLGRKSMILIDFSVM